MAEGVIGAIGAQGGSMSIGATQKQDGRLSQRFLTLLVAQMKNQSPLDPMDSSKFTSQIAQINTVIGIDQLNETLSRITGQIHASQWLQASALIGHGVLVPGNEVSVGANGAATPFGIELAAPAKEVTVSIIGPSETVVHRSTYSWLPAGVQSFAWNGKDASGQPVGQGSYRVSIKAQAADGSAVKVQPLTMRVVDGVVSAGNGFKLDLGPNGMASLDDVRLVLQEWQANT